MNHNIFKAYDIRGLYPEDIDGNDAYNIGRAFGIIVPGETTVVGYDMRTSSEEIKDALIQGLNESGKHVINIGLVSTDMVPFAVGKYGYDSGIMITASHNPAQYNGMKMCGVNAKPISPDYLMNEIKALSISGDFDVSEPSCACSDESIWDDWKEHVMSFIDPSKLKPMKIGIDAANAMACVLIPQFEQILSMMDIQKLYFDLDGTFPNHPANPLEPENTRDLIELVQEEKCVLGLAFDGDADRVFFCDHTGKMISGSIITAMIADSLLKKNPKEHIVYNAICGWGVAETIAKYPEASGHRWKVGHSYLKQKMADTKAIFAGEHSGHYYYRDNFRADSAIITVMIILELLSKTGLTLHELAKQYDTYFSSGEINSTVEDRTSKIEKLKIAFGDAKSIDELDGVSIWYPDAWCNIRPSNTEPLLRLNVEGRTQKAMESLRNKALNIIRS